MSDDPQKLPPVSAEGGQDDTNREQPQGGKQQGQGQETKQEDTKVQGGAQKLPPVSAEGGQDDTNREQPQGGKQQGS